MVEMRRDQEHARGGIGAGEIAEGIGGDLRLLDEAGQFERDLGAVLRGELVERGVVQREDGRALARRLALDDSGAGGGGRRSARNSRGPARWRG
jgi:hypothetical protein